MAKNLKTKLLLFTLVFHLAILFFIYQGYLRKNEMLIGKYIEATDFYSQKTAFILTNPPPTSTITPIPTFTSTPLPTSTELPTITPIPTGTKIPCFISIEQNARVFMQPSKGKFQDSFVPLLEELPLYGKLIDENWWLTSSINTNGQEILGWVHKDDLKNSEKCSTVESIRLSSLNIVNGFSPILEESFSSINNNWLSAKNEPSIKLVDIGDGNMSLYLRSGVNEPEISILQQPFLKGKINILTSIKRTSYTQNNYIGFRLLSLENPMHFIEIDFIENDCEILVFTESQKFPRIKLGEEASCFNDEIEDFIQLNIDLLGNLVRIDGEYNDILIPRIEIENTQYSEMQLELLVANGEVNFNYILISGEITE